MFEFKNLKILLLLMLFAFAWQEALADFPTSKYSYYVAYNKVKVNKTGAGLVYTQQGTANFDANFNSKKAEIFRNQSKSNDSNSAVCTELVDKQSAKFTFYIQAEEKEGYKFVRWINEAGEEVGTQKYCAVDVITTNYCGEYTEAESKDNTIWNNPQENNPNYYDALYTAVFEPLVKDPLIKVSSNNTNLGMTTITHEDNSNAVENDIGDDVVMFAYTLNYDKKFIGWQKNGETEIISRENPWHLQVSEENAGEYTAVFEDGYKFCRMKNFGTEHRYVTAVNDEGGLDDLTAIKLEESFDDVIANAGSVIEIYTDTEYVPIPDGEGTKKVTYHDFIVQNSSGVDKGYYNFSGGSYLRMPHYTKFFDEGTWAFSQADITYNEEGKKTGLRFRDNNGQASFASLTNDLYSQWYIEPMDKDLETCENYFSLDPNKLVEVDGKYYTTLRTSWNILIDPERTKPYVVTAVDEQAGTFEMEPITGNIIPAGTPVIIETSSTDIEANRMVPTTTAAASGAVPSGNKLVVSTKYFPNQDAPASNCKGLYRNANGQLAFGGNALTTVNGNEAYLSVDNEVVKIETLPLSEIEQVGVKDRKYIVKDQLVVIHADVDKGMLWCKDQGNKSIAKTEKQDGQIDYMREITKEQEKEWDQSNWVMLQFDQPTLNSDLENLLKTATGKYIEPATIKGTYSDVNNYTITMANQTLQLNDGGEPYVKNLYCTANFLPKNLNINGGAGAEGIYHGEPAYYFFMNPKVQEVCEITYAEWDGDNLFIAPLPSANNPTQNDSQIDGAFTVAWTYNCTNQAPSLTKGTPYRFFAVVQRTSSSNYLKDVDRYPSEDIIVYPLNLDPVNNNNVITAIDGVQSGKTITRVVYYNLMGVESDKPHPGINLVETRYSDGTRTTTKVIR